MPTHEVHFRLVVVIGLHIRLRLVFDDGALPSMALVCLGYALEVELVCITLSVHFSHYVFVIVVAQCATQLVVVHIGLALALTPTLGNLVRVSHLELTIGSLP